ncbi:hypothetical protein DESUT3_39430 [Desulfuromonas versatilis]|uniref:CHASE2 domain-containing protein n=1 Tax=Desulfuromonas versatilis TaxID=2802975 RepID=A0ABN6E6P8_9BACT|nr:CHASE2 domain-containing protein [Desulfuromonas versatilis]BCR06874.1 hypothetical protein DESUT3_39430 [Desulfuromonas versatilis]
MGVNASRLFGLAALIAAVAGTWLLSLAGLLRLPDGLLYDQLVRLAPSAGGRPGVLLIEGHPSQQLEEGAWLALVENLEGLGASRIAFSFFPDKVTEQFYQRLEAKPGLLFGRPLPAGGAAEPAPLPEAAQGRNLQVGLVAQPPSRHGVHRLQPGAYRVGAEQVPSLVALAAGRPAAEPFLVNCNGGGERLPRVSLERALQGGLVADLVRGRVVLIGLTDPATGPFLHIPGKPAAETVSLLHFQGLAVESLLGAGPIATTGAAGRLIWIAVIALLALFVYQGVRVRFAALFTAAALAAYCALAWGLLGYARYWPPLAEAATIQGLMFLLLFTRKSELETAALRDALYGTSLTLQQRVFPSNILQSQDYWSQVAVMVNQILDLNRLIFLERVAGNHRVREVRAIHCSLEDIREQRRDFQRHPYSSAIDKGSPLLLPRDFLAPGSVAEEQYLVALTFAGEVQGFWAFGVEPAKKSALPLFDEAVQAFGEQIGELLYHRQQWLERSKAEKSLFSRYLRLEGGDRAYLELKKGITLLERRLNRLEDLFRGLETATILYDLFGRVLQVNREMTELMEAAGLAPFEMTALDFTVAVTGQDPASTRRVLERIILESGEATLPAELPGHPQRRFLLKIRPLKIQESPGGEENFPFSLQGILSELVDVTDLANIWQVKKGLIKGVHDRLGEQLLGVEEALGRLEKSTDQAEREGSLQALRLSVTEAGSSLLQVQQVLQTSEDVEIVRHSPVDVRRALQEAAKRLGETAERRNIGFSFDLPDPLLPIFVPAEEFAEVLNGILGFLIGDAVENSELRIRFAVEGHYQRLSLVNTGFGLPAERFRACLFGDETLSGKEFQRLRRAVRLVRLWGGQVEGSSEVGVGTRVDLRLQGFI